MHLREEDLRGVQEIERSGLARDPITNQRYSLHVSADVIGLPFKWRERKSELIIARNNARRAMESYYGCAWNADGMGI